MQTHTAGQEIEVLIVGAGPAGLMMACQLAFHHIRFRIIDKKKHPTHYSGALIIQARSVEILHQMGIAQKVIQEGIIANNICILFNGRSILKIPVKNIGSGLTPFPYLLMVEQSKTEQLLTDVINDLGFRIERGTALVRFSHHKQGVTAHLINPDGTEETVKAQYLIAADGGQSTIRKQLKIPFIGKAHQKSLFIMDCKARTELLPDEICFSISDKTISGFFPLVNGKWRIDGTIPVELESKEQLTFDDVEKHFSERIRMNTKLYNPEWFSVFHSQQRCAASFQQSRCFLIGDAAHVHSPIGAQGMNSGLQDAFNLGWKLAFVLRGKAKPGLLDSYTTERLPIAQNIIRTTDHVFNLATSDHFFSKTFRLYLFPLMIQSLFPILGNRNWIRQYFFKSISEIGIQYRKSALSHQAIKDISLFHSPRAGDRLPYVLYYENGKEINIQEKVIGTSFHLFLFTRDLLSLEIINLAKKYNHILSFEIIFFSFKNNHLFKRFGIKNNGCCLVRPDLYIAFQSDKPQAKELKSYLEHFFELR